MTAVGRALHVLTVTPFFPSWENEVNGCFVAEPLAHLGECGTESRVIAVSPLHHGRRHEKPGVAAEWVRYPQIPGTAGMASAGRALYARLLGRVKQLHRNCAIDVIHAHGALPCGHAAALIARRLGIPFVVTVHGLDVFNTCYGGGIGAAWRRRESERVYGAARAVICVSGAVQQALLAGGPPRAASVVVYNGVDTDLFSPSVDAAEEGEVLMVGNLHRDKGHDLVLRALAKLGPAFPELRCRIIGDGVERAGLEKAVSELGLQGRVEFAGRKSRAEVAEAMRRCALFVLPSRNEGLGCVYLEAMASGKAAIGCRGQGIEEVIEHGVNGWLVPVDDLDALSQGLATLLSSRELRVCIGTAARQTIVDNLTLRHQAQRLSAMYRQAMA